MAAAGELGERGGGHRAFAAPAARPGGGAGSRGSGGFRRGAAPGPGERVRGARRRTSKA